MNNSLTTKSGRSLANKWPYPRHENFVRTLQQAATKWFVSKGLEVNPRKPYVLASLKDWRYNVILPEVADYIEAEMAARSKRGVGFSRHNNLHNGLSSQAMIFNLVGPLVVRNDLELLKPIFEDQGITWPQGLCKASFEYENRVVFNEDYGQPTSIDLILINGDDKPEIFLEAKLVETEFGGCSVFAGGNCDGGNLAQNFDLCYLHFIGRRYWRLLQKHGFINGALSNDSTCILATHYQFFREILFTIELGGVFILLSDERSPTFLCDGPMGKRGLMIQLLSYVPENLRNRVAMVSIQQVVQAIRSSGRHGWIQEFKNKYGLDAH